MESDCCAIAKGNHKCSPQLCIFVGNREHLAHSQHRAAHVLAGCALSAHSLLSALGQKTVDAAHFLEGDDRRVLHILQGCCMKPWLGSPGSLRTLEWQGWGSKRSLSLPGNLLPKGTGCFPSSGCCLAVGSVCDPSVPHRESQPRDPVGREQNAADPCEEAGAHCIHAGGSRQGHPPAEAAHQGRVSPAAFLLHPRRQGR